MPAEPLPKALARLRSEVLDEESFVRAVASGRQKGRLPRWRRVELRYVDLRTGPHLQVTAYDQTQAHTSNHAAGDRAREAVDALLEEPFGSWHVTTTREVLQLRVTKRLEALVHATPRDAEPAAPPTRRHDRDKPRVLPEDDPVLRVVGISDEQGHVKPSRQAKYRQVEEFLRSLGAAVDDALTSGRLRTPTPEDPLRVVDLGCGNAYLTFAAHAYLSRVRELPVRVLGVDVKEQSRAHSTRLAEELGITDSVRFLQGDIGSVELDWPEPPDVVLALHACDTATDDALARAVAWEAALVLAAPCCHHDVAAQLRRSAAPAPYQVLMQHGILRERFADTLTDALRAGVLRRQGYRVDVVEFVESRHTPRNTLIRATRVGAPGRPGGADDVEALAETWNVRPRLVELLENSNRVSSDRQPAG